MFTVTNITIINEHSVFNVQKKNIWSMLILQLLNFNTTNSSNFKKKKMSTVGQINQRHHLYYQDITPKIWVSI